MLKVLVFQSFVLVCELLVLLFFLLQKFLGLLPLKLVIFCSRVRALLE